MNDFQQLVYTRLQSLPKDCIISAGDFGDVTKDDALEHVKTTTKLGSLSLLSTANILTH